MRINSITKLDYKFATFDTIKNGICPISVNMLYEVKFILDHIRLLKYDTEDFIKDNIIRDRLSQNREFKIVIEKLKELKMCRTTTTEHYYTCKLIKFIRRLHYRKEDTKCLIESVLGDKS